MKKAVKFVAVLLLMPLFTACSKGPSDSEVKDLIKAQYDQADSMMDSAMASAGNSDIANAMSHMMSGMIPKLEKVDNVNCDETEDKKAFLCTAEITQTLNGESHTVPANFMVHEVNDEWVLRQ